MVGFAPNTFPRVPFCRSLSAGSAGGLPDVAPAARTVAALLDHGGIRVERGVVLHLLALPASAGSAASALREWWIDGAAVNLPTTTGDRDLRWCFGCGHSGRVL